MRKSYKRKTTNDCRPTTNLPEGQRNEPARHNLDGLPTNAADLLNELHALRKALSGDLGTPEDRLGLLSASVARLVEQLPVEDPLGVGERLLGALSDLCAAVGSARTPGGRQRRPLQVRAKAAAAEAAYLVELCQRLHMGRPEQVDSTIGRVEELAGALT
jgi:hypothetical protein